LHQNPLRILQDLSRSTTLLVAWPGQIQGKYLSYAEPGHPEYQQYEITDFLAVDLTERHNHGSEGTI